MLDFTGSTILITGAGGGIGKQHALMLAERGANIVVNDFGGDPQGKDGNNSRPEDIVVSEIRAAGGNAQAACCDIGDRSQVDTMFAGIIANFGRIDAVIHNASVFAPWGNFTAASNSDLEHILKVNVIGGWNVSQAAWPHMQKQGYGRIVHTGSAAGYFGHAYNQAYSAAKASLMGLTKVLAFEGDQLGIKVNMLGPAAWTQTAAQLGAPSFMAELAPPSAIASVIALLVHESCPVNGEFFHTGAGYISRVFVGETEGVVLDPESLSPETVAEHLNQVMDTSKYHIPKISGQSQLWDAVMKHSPLAKRLIQEARDQAGKK